MVPLGSVPDVLSLIGRRSDVAASRILQGRDARSMHVLFPNSRGLYQNFHDFTIVYMGVAPESTVSLTELSLLREQWPPAILRHMGWLQQDLEVMRADAKKRFKRARCGAQYPGAQYPGVQCGRAIYRTVWIMLGGRTMSRG